VAAWRPDTAAATAASTGTGPNTLILAAPGEGGSEKPLPHRYDVRLSGGPNGYATVSTAGVPDLRSAPPLDFDGPGDAWSPEHLLLAAVETCFLFTLRAVAKTSRIEFIALDLSSEGTVDRWDGITRFTEIVLRPRLTIPAGTDRDRARARLQARVECCWQTVSAAGR
jgi:organic hydroperoxide reductase OsmC/OhrA